MNEHAGQGAAAHGAVWYEEGAIVFLVEIGNKLLSRYCTPEALPQVVLACVRQAQGARGASAREKTKPTVEKFLQRPGALGYVYPRSLGH